MSRWVEELAVPSRGLLALGRLLVQILPHSLRSLLVAGREITRTTLDTEGRRRRRCRTRAVKLCQVVGGVKGVFS